jgi:hypothetical protein
MSHLARFKIVYIQILVALASSIGGELIGMKDLKKEELAALTWVAWTICLCNILGNTGNTIIAIFNPVPISKGEVAAPQKPSTPEISPTSLP